MNPAGFASRNAKVILFVVLVAAVLGVRAYLTAPQSIFPTMRFARIDVVADVGDLPPEQVRAAVTRPLEQALQALPSVTDVLATASQGSAEALVTFSDGTDPQADLQLVDQAIGQLRSGIPAASNIVAVAVDPNREPVLSYALTSPDLSQAVLRQIALTQLAPRLYGTPGLGRILVAGGADTELHVRLDPAALANAGIGASDVTAALAGANAVRAIGTFHDAYQRYAVLLDASLRDAASLGAVRVPLKGGGSLPLGSLGDVVPGVSPVTDQTSIDGTHAVVVNAYALPGADTVAMANAFRERLAAAVPTLPRDVAVRSFWDETTLIVASQSALRDAILIGALLAVIVIFVFLRDLRLTLVAAAVIPLAMAIALLALRATGQTLNLMSVGGLAVAVGLIIDDAIVVIESIARERRAHPERSPDEAVERSMRQLSGAMIASTATTVVVFLPLALLSGVTGYFFRALAFTLAASLIVSLGLALFVAPTIARALMRRHAGAAHADAGSQLVARYEPLLRWALSHRPAVAIASAAVLVVTSVLLVRLPSDFLPAMDEGQFEIAYTMPVGTTLAASDAAATQMERVVIADPAVADVGRLTGIDSNGVSPTQPNQGLLRVRLKPANRRAAYDEVSARLRDRLGATIPAATYDFHQILEDLIDDLSGAPAPIEVIVQGPDQSTLISLAQRVATAIGTVPGIVDASPGVTYDAPSLHVAPRGAALAALGITPSDVGDAVAALGQGTVATMLPGTATLVPVRVIVGSAGDGLVGAETPVYAKGVPTALGDLASLSTRRLASDIVTENGQLQMRVTANVNGASLSSVVDGIRTKLRTVALVPGYRVSIGGQAASQARSFGEFASVIAIAVALVFAVMLATFRSYRLPLVVLTAIPLALIGVALGLFVTGTPVNVSSFMGLLLLVGIVVKNGILLIDVANRRRAAGDDVVDALVAAGRTRLRPILMTTLAAIGGLLPLALGLGQGAEMERPLAIAVIGGLSTATLFTLIVIPVLYDVFTGARRSASAPVATALLLAGCLFAPHPAAAQAAVEANAAPTIPAFGGLSLDAAEASAIVASPDVAAARARLAQRRAAYDEVRGGAVPSFVGTYVQTPQGNPPGPNVISRSVSAQLQFALADLLALAPTVREAALNVAAAEADEAAAETAERVKTIGLYYDALTARGIVDARRSSLALANAQRAAAAVRNGAGDAPRLDVIRADVAVAQAEADLESAGATDANATDALLTETAAAASTVATTVDRPAPVPNAALGDPATVASLARAQRTEVRSATLLARAADAAVASARGAGIPPIVVSGGFLTGTDSGVPVNAPTIDASMTIPLSGVAHARVAEAQARADEARAKAAAVERAVVLEATAAARTLAATERAEAASTRARDAAERVLRATEVGYRNGASSSLDVTTARAAYAQALVDEIASRFAVAKARATLDAEIGS